MKTLLELALGDIPPIPQFIPQEKRGSTGVRVGVGDRGIGPRGKNNGGESSLREPSLHPTTYPPYPPIPHTTWNKVKTSKKQGDRLGDKSEVQVYTPERIKQIQLQLLTSIWHGRDAMHIPAPQGQPKQKLTPEAFRAWAIRHGYREDAHGNFVKTKQSGKRVRFYMTKNSVQYETQLVSEGYGGKTERRWVRSRSGYIRDCFIGATTDKLHGLSIFGCKPASMIKK